MGNISFKAGTSNLGSYSGEQQQISNLDSLTNYLEDMNDLNLTLIEDLLVDILSFVPAHDLIKNCRLVCKEWKELIDGQSVWKMKCLRVKRNIPSAILEVLPANYYRNIYFHNPYNRNLIQNPCGDERFREWTLEHFRGQTGFIIENPPAGADPLPKEVGSQSCFATTYYQCLKYQIIDLDKIGVSRELLQLKSTKIEVGEWYCARFDCSAEYHLYVFLLNDEFDLKEEFSDQEHRVVDRFRFNYREEQWMGKEWHFVNHVFENLAGVKYIYFQDYGKDCMFWAGHYGMKMTGSYVKIIV